MVATLVAASICFLAPHAANAQRQSKGGKTNDTYFVVHILNPPEDQVNGRTANGQNPTDQQVDLTKEYMVLAASELKTKQETYDKDYKTRIEKWNEERKNGVIDADTPKPPKTTIKKLRTFKLKERRRRVPEKDARRPCQEGC